MAKVRNVDETKPPKGVTRLSLFGDRPLFAGEDAAAYDQLLARISAAVKPADVIEEIWIQDVADLSWEVLRLRRLKTDLLTCSAHTGLRIVLDVLLGYQQSRDLSQQWAARIPEAVQQVERVLAGAEMTMDVVMAQTLSVVIHQIERIDRLIMSAEARRNAVLREIDRHRTAPSEKHRRTTNDVGEAEFEVIAPQPQLT